MPCAVRILLRTLVICSFAHHTFAQSDDPGTAILEEQQRKQRQQQLERAQAGQDIKTPETKGPVQEVTCFPIDTINVTGVTIFKEKDVAPIIAEFAGHCLGQVSIGIFLQRLTNLYAEKGYITTRAYIPAQDISSRTLVVEVLEGRIEAFIYQQVDKNGKPKAGKRRKITFAFPIRTGDVFQLRDIEHGLEQINRLTSSQANANLAAGQAPGTSRVFITEQKIDKFRATFSTDNRGDDDTGKRRVSLSFELDDFLNLNETYALSYSGSENTNALAFSFSIPFRKWLFSANGSYSESLSPVTALSDLFTQTSNANVQLERLMYRDATSKYFLYGSASSYWNERFINIVALTPQHRSTARFGLRHEHRLEKSVISADTSYSYGAQFLRADWDPPVVAPGAPRADFKKLETRINYIRPFKNGWQISSIFTGQMANVPLFSNEQIAIGGWDSVRGYANFSTSGDTGGYLRTELSLPTQNIDLRGLGTPLKETSLWNPFAKAQGGYRAFLFADMGHLYARSTQSSSNTFGIGAGVTAQVGRLSVSFTLAMPLRDQNGQTRGTVQSLFNISTKVF